MVCIILLHTHWLFRSGCFVALIALRQHQGALSRHIDISRSMQVSTTPCQTLAFHDACIIYLKNSTITQQTQCLKQLETTQQHRTAVNLHEAENVTVAASYSVPYKPGTVWCCCVFSSCFKHDVHCHYCTIPQVNSACIMASKQRIV